MALGHHRLSCKVTMFAHKGMVLKLTTVQFVNRLGLSNKCLIVHLPTYLAFHPNKTRQNAAVINSCKCFQSKNLLHIVQKILSLGIIRCTLKKNMLNRHLTCPTSRTFLGHILLACLPNSSKSPWLPQNVHGYFKKSYFKYSLNPTTCFNSL